MKIALVIFITLALAGCALLSLHMGVDLAAGVPRGKAARELHIFKELSIPEGF